MADFAPLTVSFRRLPQSVPETLSEQLADGGRLIAPIGLDQHQQLILYIRDGEIINGFLDTALFPHWQVLRELGVDLLRGLAMVLLTQSPGCLAVPWLFSQEFMSGGWQY